MNPVRATFLPGLACPLRPVRLAGRLSAPPPQTRAAPVAALSRRPFSTQSTVDPSQSALPVPSALAPSSGSNSSSTTSTTTPTPADPPLPWYLQPRPGAPPTTKTAAPTPAPIALPPDPPRLLEPLIDAIHAHGFVAPTLLDLRPIPATPLGPRLLMLVATAHSDRHLHIAAGRVCRWLRSAEAAAAAVAAPVEPATDAGAAAAGGRTPELAAPTASAAPGAREREEATDGEGGDGEDLWRLDAAAAGPGGLRVRADGLLGRAEMKVRRRRYARRMRALAMTALPTTTSRRGSGRDGSGGLGGLPDDGFSTGWVCVNVGGVPEGTTVVLQLVTAAVREELKLEQLWTGRLEQTLKAAGREK